MPLLTLRLFNRCMRADAARGGPTLPALCVVLVLAALIACATAAQAQPRDAECTPYADAARTLEQRHRERLVATAANHEGSRVELWASAGGASWTAIVVVGGHACPLAHGARLVVVARP